MRQSRYPFPITILPIILYRLVSFVSNNYYDDFSVQSFLLCLWIAVLPFGRNRPFPHLLINYSYQCILMNSYFILRIIVSYCHYLFCCSNCSSLGWWGGAVATSICFYILLTSPYYFFSIFLISSSEDVLRSSYTLSVLELSLQGVMVSFPGEWPLNMIWALGMLPRTVV